LTLATQIAGAVARAQFTELGALSHTLWRAYEAGHIGEAEAHALSEQLEARKPKPGAVPSFAQVRTAKAPHSPDKQASIERRRRLARASPVPPEHVDKFTTCEHAAITVMVEQIRKHGVCSLCMDAIAALAGTCRTIVRNAMRKGRALGLLHREERRRRGQKSLTNLVRILQPAWRAWVQWRGRRNTSTSDERFRKDGTAGVGDRSGERSATAATGHRGLKQTE
jgi:hypothetical protein